MLQIRPETNNRVRFLERKEQKSFIAADTPLDVASVDDSSLAEVSPRSEVGMVSGPSLHDAEEASSALILYGKKQYVQQAGAFIVLALLQAFGSYRHAEMLRKDTIQEGDADRRHLGKAGLRVALDAAIIALVAGQKCIEGVRRVATPSAKTLFACADCGPVGVLGAGRPRPLR